MIFRFFGLSLLFYFGFTIKITTCLFVYLFGSFITTRFIFLTPKPASTSR